MKQLFVFILCALFAACNRPANTVVKHNPALAAYESEHFKKYWYSGKAEVNSYELNQSRYGEIRNGNAMLIFVTEDFSKSKLVKLDEPDLAGSDKLGVLKLNFTKNFITGIYPYSMMLSTFTPVSRKEFPNSVKFSMSSQEWCGHVFTQMTWRDHQYAIDSYSYFEKEGDSHHSISATLVEDEIMNIIRLDPKNLPLGEIQLIPGLFYSRLLHQPVQSEMAEAAKHVSGEQIIYTVSYKNIPRSLKIVFETAFPHRILSWEEVFTERGQQYITTGALKKTLLLDYWTKNKNEFQFLRDSLHLTN